MSDIPTGRSSIIGDSRRESVTTLDGPARKTEAISKKWEQVTEKAKLNEAHIVTLQNSLDRIKTYEKMTKLFSGIIGIFSGISALVGYGDLKFYSGVISVTLGCILVSILLYQIILDNTIASQKQPLSNA